MDINKERIGKRIKSALDAAKKTQRELAGALNVSESSVTGYVRGVNEPSSQGLAVIAELCGVSIDWIITGKEQAATKSVTREDALIEVLQAVVVGDNKLLNRVREAAGDCAGQGNEGEQKLLTLYRKLGQADRDKVIEIARLYAGEREG